MTTSMQSEWIKEAYNGGGWENSIKISSFDELRSELLSLGTSISFNDDFIGFTDASAELDARLYFSETEINDYRSYLTSSKDKYHIFDTNHHYNDDETTYNGSPISLTPSTSYNLLNSLPLGTSESETAYLTINLDSTGFSLENGFHQPIQPNSYTPPYTGTHVSNTPEVNPEIVFELNDDFWSDIQNIQSGIELQKSIGDNIQFEVNGFNNTVDLSSLRYSNDNPSIQNIVEQFNFTLVTNEKWDLPFYGGANIRANVKAYNNDGSETFYDFYLKDHDLISGHQPPAVTSGLTGAVELTEDGNSTVLEFGLDQWRLQELIEVVQNNWNNSNSQTFFEVDTVELDFHSLPNGHYYLNSPVYSGGEVLKVNPVVSQSSDFSELSDIGIEITGDFNSVIDVWEAGVDSPSIKLASGSGLTKYRDANLHLNYEAIPVDPALGTTQHLNISSHIDGSGRNDSINAMFTGNYSSDEIVDFRLNNISFNANTWNLLPQGTTSPAPSINWYYNTNSPGMELYWDQAGNPVYIEDIIPNFNDIRELSFSNLNNPSAVDNLDASIELTQENNRLPWNIDYTEPEPSDTLETYYSLQELDQLAVLGDSVDEFNKYDLTITAKMLGDLRLEGAGLTIGYDNTLFTNLTESDVYLGSSFMPSYTDKPSQEDGSQFGGQPIYVDHANGEIHISAFSAEDLGQGKAISEESIFATISLDFNEDALRQLEKNSDGSLKINPLSFTIKADQDETIFTKDFDDGTGYGNREIQSLRDLNKEIVVEGREVTLYDAAINLEQLGDGLVLGTQRVIGANQGFTNLIRSGDTITSTVDWRNVGNITAKNLQVYGEYNDHAHLVNYSLSQNSLNSGSFQGGQFFEDGREDVTITAAIEVTGSAGEVLDISNGIFSIEADGSSIAFENRGKGSANLITYAGDLNYDGRVSMKDLAYLNAGAARQIDQSDGSVVEESVAKDVDANFDGIIDMADLTVLDQDWGRTLHTGDETFTGSNATLNWDSLDSQASSTWDNTAFKEQNQVEAGIAYVETLGTAGDLSSTYDTSTPNTGDGGDTGTETSTI